MRFRHIIIQIGNPIGSYLAILLSLKKCLSSRGYVNIVMLLVYSTFLNKNVFGDPPGWSMLRVIILLVVSALFIITRRSFADRRIVHFLVLSFLLIIHSLIFSKSPEISLLKSLSFSLVVIALFQAIKYSDITLEFVLTIGHKIMLLSLFLVVIGYGTVSYENLNGVASYVVGAFKHPNAMGMLLTPVAVFHIVSLFSKSIERSLGNLIISFSYILLLFLSGSRGAMLSLIFSVFFSLILGFRRSYFKWILGLFLVVATIASSTGFERFISKDAHVVSSLEDLGAERYDRVLGMISNISASPLSGIGLGIHSDFDNWLNSSRIKRDPYFGIPYSASVEKGTFYIAAFEELGILLGFYVVFILGLMLLIVSKRAKAEYVAVYLACLSLNLSEAVLFSMNGVGPIIWIYILTSVYGKD